MLLSDGGIQFRLEQLLNGKVMLRHTLTNIMKEVSEYQLISAIQSGNVLVAPHASNIAPRGLSDGTNLDTASVRKASEATVQIMLEKRRWIDALARLGITNLVDEPWVRVAIEKLGRTELIDIKKFAISTLRTAERKVRKAGGDWSVLIPMHSMRGGKGKPRIDPRAEMLLGQILTKTREQRGPIVKQTIIDELRVSIRSANLALPGDEIEQPGASTISRRVDQQFTRYDICVRNSGRNKADRLYRNNALCRDTAEFPLLISEYDDTDCGVFLIDPRTQLPHGRAYLTIGVCQNSHVPLGFDLGHQPRSYDSAMGAIADSLLPKDMGQPCFSKSTQPWIGYGVQGTMLMDNAQYNTSNGISHHSGQMKLILAGARPYGPTEKATIEHFNWRLKSDFCTQLPGWRGDKSDPDSVKSGMSHAILTINEFKQLFTQWATDQYLNKPGEDGFTPKQRWSSHFKHHSPAVRWSADQISFLRMRPFFLRFRANGGLETLGLRYWSEQLSILRKEIGAKSEVIAYQDNRDMTFILVEHPRTKSLIRVPCVMDPGYITGLTRHQQTLIKRFARTLKINNSSMSDLVSARLKFQKHVEQLAKSKKLKDRKLSMNAGDLKIHEDTVYVIKSESKQSADVREIVMTELEYSLHELEAVELDESEKW